MWQAIYDEVKDDGLEIIAVAFDTGGKDAVASRIRCEDLAERPEALGRLMGWNEELWGRQSPPQYPCLIDESHRVAELFGMTNVPQSVWIDEEGRIVRPAESAGTIDVLKDLNRETLEIPDESAERGAQARLDYINALKDWVAKGADSAYALPPAEVKRRMRGTSDAEVKAANHARLGQHLYSLGALESAKQHFAEASRLHPESWNYRRQSMMLDPECIGEINGGPDFWEAVDASEGDYYPAADLTPVN